MYRWLALTIALALPALADQAGDAVKAGVKEGAKDFRDMLAATDRNEKQAKLKAAYEAFMAAFKDEKQDTAASSQVEEEAGAFKTEDKALFYYIVCDSYCRIQRWKAALGYIDKAIALVKKEAYVQKKKEIEEKLK